MSKFDSAKFNNVFSASNLTTSSTVYKYFLTSASVVHILYTVIFFIIGVYPLAIYNIFSTMLYAILASNFKLKRLRPFLLIINAELLAVIISCVYYLGWAYNFYLYINLIVLLSILSSMNYKKKTYNLKYAYIQFVIMIITMATLVIYSNVNNPIYTFKGSDEALLEILDTMHVLIVVTTSFIILVAFIQDTNATAIKLDSMNSELTFIATHDPLTNLINRRSMSDEFTKAGEAFAEKKTPYSIILADIDDFKKVNDIYGHDFGDIVLKRTSKIIMDIVGDKGSVCRWGGEEILILTHTELNSTVKLAEQIRSTIQSTSFVFNNTYVKATLTLGVSTCKKDIPVNKIITEADSNLYKGKKSTKNCVVS